MRSRLLSHHPRNRHRRLGHEAPPFQYNLRFLLAAATLVCLIAAAWRSFGGAAVIVPLTAILILLGGSDRRRAAWGAGIGLLSFVHAAVSEAAYDQFGFSVTFFSYAALILHLPAVVLYLMGKCAAALRWSAAVALLVVAPQVVWWNRLTLLYEEVPSIVKFAERKHGQSGRYPANLDDYTWRHRSLEKYVEYSLGRSDDEMVVYFQPSPRTEPHWYSSTSGYGYDPD